MIEKPTHFSQQYAEPFQDESVAAAYRFRPAYPDATFAILRRLISARPRYVLDVGCGTGNIARPLVSTVERVDAVDFSHNMIAYGRQLPHGDHPNLRWLHGRIEDVALEPPYSLITAGASLHWLDWNVVFPRFHTLLSPGGYLAVVTAKTTPDPWTPLQPVISEYRIDGGFQPFDMFAALARHGLFQIVGEEQTAPVTFNQSIDDYVKSYHSRSGFSRERLGEEKAAAFRCAAREMLLAAYPDGRISLKVMGHVIWGVPSDGRA